MTIARDPGTLEAVVMETLQNCTPACIKKYTGQEAATFYKKANPGDQRKLSADDCIDLDAARVVSGLPRRFIPLMAELTDVKLNGHVAPAQCIKTMMLELEILEGDLAKAVLRAMDDGRIDPHEAREIDMLAQAKIDKLQAIQQAVKPRQPGEVA